MWLQYLKTVQCEDCEIGHLYIPFLRFPLLNPFLLDSKILKDCQGLLSCKEKTDWEVKFQKIEGGEEFLENNISGLICFPLCSGNFYEVVVTDEKPQVISKNSFYSIKKYFHE